MSAPLQPARRPLALLTEGVVVLLLLTALLLQLLRYPASPDTIGADYRAYGEHLAATGTLMPSARLPGYPAFIALSIRLLSGAPAEAVYWAQLWLLMLFSVGCWAVVRCWFGAFTAACFLGLLAAPNVLARWAAVMLPDALFAMLMLPYLLGLGWWALAARQQGGWRWLPVVAAAVLVLHTIHPAAWVLLLLWPPALMLALLVGGPRADDRARLAPVRAVLVRLGAALATTVLILAGTHLTLDTGAGRFAADVLAYRVVVALPPAANDAPERRIEDVKRRFRNQEGEPIESARFGTYDKVNLLSVMRAADVRAVWWARLTARPGLYVAAVLNSLRWDHDLAARQLVPYFSRLTAASPLTERYPRDDGSPAGDLFRATGLVVLERRPLPAHAELEVDTASAILRLLSVWGLAALGAWQTWKSGRSYWLMLVAFGALFVAFVLVVAVSNTLHVRYLLPFVPLLMLLQAIGVSWLLRTLARPVTALARPVAALVTEPGRAATGLSVVGSRLERSARPRGALIAEGVVLATLCTLLLIQLLTYAVTSDPDPDGYVTYARVLAFEGRLPSSGRLPGYPLFLALLLRISDAPIAVAVYWTQFASLLVFTVALWVFVRRCFGALPALCLAGILAAPSYFTQMSVIMLPDAPYAILMLPFMLGVGWWALAQRPRGGWWWLPVFALAMLALQAIRPTTFVLVLLFAVALVVSVLLCRWAGAAAAVGLARPSRVLLRAGALAATMLAVMTFCDHFLDTGARRQNAEILAFRVVTRLPAASDSPAEQRVEAARQRFSEVDGQPIEEARFGTYERYNLMAEVHPDDANAVWRDRLAAYPGRYMWAIVEEVRLGHHMLARVALPYYFDTGRYSTFLVRYPRNDGSMEGDLFRRTGLMVADGRPPAAHLPFEAATAAAILELVCIWGLLALGIWREWRRYGVLALAFVLMMGAFVAAVATTNTVDARYLLPFAPLVYLGQALGMVWLLETLADRPSLHRPSLRRPEGAAPEPHPAVS